MSAWQETLVGCLARAASGTVGRAPPGVDDALEAGLGLRFIDRRERASYLPYATLWQRCQRLAATLQQLGLQRGDRVALLLPTSEDFPLAFFATMLLGAVPVPLYPPVRLGRLDEYHRQTAGMLQQIGARLILTDQRIARILGRTMALYAPALGCHTLKDLGRSEPGARTPEWTDCQPDQIAFIQFSSGTTSDPKPVCLTHRQVLANATRIQSQLMHAYPEDDSFVHAGVSWLPLYHDMGLVGCLVVAVAHPGELTLIPPELFVADPVVWLRTIARYRGTISPAPNFAFSLCVDRIADVQLKGLDLSGWKVALNGAEPVSPSVLTLFMERFSRCGLPAEALSPVYGLAEATLALTFSPLDRPFTVRHFDAHRLTREARAVLVEDDASMNAQGQPLVSVGRPLADYEVRVLDPRRQPLAEGRVGRVWARGPSIMNGYYERPDLDEKVLVDGWLDTGDEGFFWDGELYLYGRAKDLIIVNGRNIAPQELELALDDVPGVRTGCTAATGVMLERGERLHLFVEIKQGFDGDRASLSQAVSAQISTKFGIGRSEVVLLSPGTLPRTSSGKIRRTETRRRYLAGTLLPPERVGPLLVAKELFRSWRAPRRGSSA